MHPEIRKTQREIFETFNHNSKAGIAKIKEICEKNNIAEPEAIADFFHQQKKNLDLEAVGEYLGAPKNKDVLKAFAEQMDFAGKSMIESMRNFFSEFQLPKEGQQVGELIAAFSEAYYNNNPQEFAHQDAALLVAYQIMLLNTDLHNPNVVKRMTMDEHKRQLQGGNKEPDSQDNDFAPKFLEDIYNEIKADPIKFSFVKASPGYELSSANLFEDPTFKQLDSWTASPHENLLPKIGGEDVTATIDQPKSFLSFLTGYNGTITLTDEQTKGRATVQVYNPGVFSKLFFGEQPRIIVQPVYQDGKTKESINLAAKVAASFTTPANSIKATYDFEKTDLVESYNIERTKDFKKQMQESDQNLQQEGGMQLK